MGRKVQVPKERILDTAFELLKREGGSAVSITRIARELGTSTQPISWQFGGMDKLRGELAARAQEYLNQKANQVDRELRAKQPPLATLYAVGKAEVDLVYDEPNLVEFARFTRRPKEASMLVDVILEDETHHSLIKAIARQYGLSVNDARAVVRDCTIFSQGICSMILTGMLEADRKTTHRIVKEHGARLIASFGLPFDQVMLDMEQAQA